MAKLNTWKDFKEVLFKSQDLKIEVYTSYMSLIDDFLYRVHDIDDEIESNLLKVYPVSIWMELNPRGGNILNTAYSVLYQQSSVLKEENDYIVFS